MTNSTTSTTIPTIPVAVPTTAAMRLVGLEVGSPVGATDGVGMAMEVTIGESGVDTQNRSTHKHIVLLSNLDP